MSAEHFSVDGTPVAAEASLESFNRWRTSPERSAIRVHNISPGPLSNDRLLGEDVLERVGAIGVEQLE